MTKTHRHIVWFTPSAGGGHPQYTRELLSALATDPARGDCTFELVSSIDLEPPFRDPKLPYAISAVLPELKHRSKYPSKLSWIVGRLTHYPRRERAFLKWLAARPDVTDVHLQEWTPWLATTFVRRIQRMGKRVFFTAHNVYPHRYPPLLPKLIMHRWLRNASLACDGLFVLTDRLREQLVTFLGTAVHPPIDVVPHGIWHVVPPPNCGTLAERVAKKRLLFFGAIRRNKGLDFLLSAMKEMPDYALTIAGAPLESDYFEKEIVPAVERLRAAGVKIDLRAAFIADEDLPQLFAEHSAIALPYTADFNAQSGVIFMAMAHDTPVIASEAGGLGELMSTYKVGATFADRTPQAFAAAVRSLEAPGAADAIESAIGAAKTHFSWTAAAKATLAGYNRAIAPDSSIKNGSDSNLSSHNDRTIETNFAA